MNFLTKVFFLISLTSYSFSQSISNVTAIQQGNNAVVSYDLNGTPGNSYYVKLFYSTDGGQTFGNELLQVTGDVKSGVKTGTGKRITWAADKEVNYVNSSVVFKVEAETRRASAKPVTIENITVEVVNAKRSGDDLIIEFIVTQNSEKEIWNLSLLRGSRLTTQDGTQYEPLSGKFGTNHLNSFESGNVQCQKAVPAKGILTFKVEQTEQVLAALKINLATDKWTSSSFVIRSIPVL